MLIQLVNSKSQMEDWFSHVLLSTSSSLTVMILKLLMAERLENIYADCASNKIPRAAISPERLMEEVDSINHGGGRYGGGTEAGNPMRH